MLHTYDLVNFNHLHVPESPNYYLVCPQSHCNDQASAASPIFSVPVEKLMQAWQTAIKQEPRTKKLINYPIKKQMQYVQRSAVFRFPDYFTVQFIGLSRNRSTLILYSKAKYGYYDFGVNKKRVERLLQALREQLRTS